MSKEEKVDIIKWMKIVDEEINVKSDRALVITIGSILDTQLESLLKNFLIKDNKIDERLFNNNSPLSNFDSKIWMCYYLGIISKYEYKALEIIRKIRNIFAHEIEIKKLEDSQSIRDLCKTLNIPEEIYIPDNFFISVKEEEIKFEDMSLSEKIIKVFKNMTVYLEFRRVDLFQCKRTEYKNLSFVQLLEECMRKVTMNSLQIYELNVKHKELLLLELKNIENDSDEKNELKAQIEKIDKLLNAYSNGNILYGLDIDENETKKALNSINQSVKKLQKDS